MKLLNVKAIIHSTEKGFSLIEILVSLSIVIIGIFVMEYYIIHYNYTIGVGLLRKVQAHNILINTAKKLQEVDFFEAQKLCQFKGALNVDRQGQCLNGSFQLNTGLETKFGVDADTGQTKIVEYLKNWDDENSSDGKVCIDLVRCDDQASQYILQIRLVARWQEGAQVFSSAPLVFYRGRW